MSEGEQGGASLHPRAFVADTPRDSKKNARARTHVENGAGRTPQETIGNQIHEAADDMDDRRHALQDKRRRRTRMAEPETRPIGEAPQKVRIEYRANAAFSHSG
jgi:hypothetical protein